MTRIKWDKRHSVGVKIIDEQHKHFIELLNKLYECLGSDDTSKLADIISNLADYTELHFKTEEDYFEKFNYEGAAEHKVTHDEIRAKVKGFLDKKGDPKAIGFELLYFLERWLFIHLDGKDKKYTECFNQHGLH